MTIQIKVRGVYYNCNDRDRVKDAASNGVKAQMWRKAPTGQKGGYLYYEKEKPGNYGV